MNNNGIATRLIAAVLMTAAATGVLAGDAEDRETYLDEARQAVEAQGRAALDALEADMRTLDKPELDLPVQPEALARAARKDADSEDDRG